MSISSKIFQNSDDQTNQKCIYNFNPLTKDLCEVKQDEKQWIQ